MANPKAYENVLVDYWIKNYINEGVCSLCGNSGRVDTRGVKNARGVECGRLQWCICPNGRESRDLDVNGDLP